MANVVPKSAADLNTQIDSAVYNPNVTTTGNRRSRRVVHLTLVIENVDFNPDLLYDALDSQFAVVAGEKGGLDNRGCYIWNIGPA